MSGWLSLSNVGPTKGTLELLPDIKLSSAYILLHPFFNDEIKLDMDSTYFYGAETGMGQVVKDSWLPHLQIPRTFISVPACPPGFYVF
jgi:hypothetical protein